MKRINALFTACAATLIVSPVFGTTIYTYTGNIFHQQWPIVDLNKLYTLSASFTVPTPLAPNLAWQTPVNPTSWTFTDGQGTLSSLTDTLFVLNVQTDANGDILFWYFRAHSDTLYLHSDNPADSSVFDGNEHWVKFGQGEFTDYGFNNASPGTWSASTEGSEVPEPRTIALLIGGGVLLGVKRWLS